ncbi:MAG: hypothetical protein KA352_15645 [Flavobacteriales bacterium]|nr:hypothetical protein [Flavobacteriales bacterium]
MVAFCVHDEDDRAQSTTNKVATGSVFDLAIGSGAGSCADTILLGALARPPDGGQVRDSPFGGRDEQ